MDSHNAVQAGEAIPQPVTPEQITSYWVGRYGSAVIECREAAKDDPHADINAIIGTEV